MRSKLLPIVFVFVLSILIMVGVFYQQKLKNTSDPTAYAPPGASEPGNPLPKTPESPMPGPSALMSPGPSGLPVSSTSPNPSQSSNPQGSAQSSNSDQATAPSNPNPDLTVDASGLSKATVFMNTSQGLIKFKFYPQDAPNTVHRVVELIGKGFYNGLAFHRVVPGFVIQGGDPQGNGTGGSGQKLKAEFNNRRHIEGTVAMARAADPDSADSQFYISLGTHPHLDRSYTVFGQVVEGMEAARKIKVGDKMTAVRIE